MDIKVIDLGLPAGRARYLAELAKISIGFDVTHIFDVHEEDGTFILSKRRLERQYVKDYDALKGEGPMRWQRRFNLANWGLIFAYDGAVLAGGMALAYRSPDTRMLEGREDLVIIWDLRVAEHTRGLGIGTRLLHEAENWARERRCIELKVETQNVNVPACSFYARNGFILGAINRSAYPELPGEVQLLWHKRLD